ncbi:cell adhesion molecule Dscam1 isoform X3 [Parasteatoda tepidariorum]|uniref:cell adhesion molecule Dscam1 isoform X3 n=1 Tax=Parasteatoda tepidariorum TaxID=114398 RepID=UPI0039BC9FA6
MVFSNIMWIKIVVCACSLTVILCRNFNAQSHSNTRQSPSFLHEPLSRHEFLNSTGAIIPCTAFGSPSPVVRWLNNDGTAAVDIPGLRHVRLDGSLVFQPFRADQYRQDVHAATYRCTATNSFGTLASRDVHIGAVMPQRYAVEMHDEFVLKGNTAVLKCHVPGFVKDYVIVEAWIKDSMEKVDPSSKSSRYTIFKSGELHIRHVQQTDSLSSYSCRTKHRLTGLTVVSSNPARIIVTEPYGQVPPRITHTSSRILIQTGETALLPCAGQAFPLPNYRWYRKEASTTPVRLGHRREMVGGTLILRNAEIRDSGRYICVLTSSGNEDKAETELTVTAKLSVSVYPHERIADIGEVVTFNCSVRGYPVSNVRWSKNAKFITDSNRMRVIARNQLMVTSVRREDHGLYQCFVNNDKDSAQGAAQLLIGDNPPEFLHTFENMTVNPGSSVSLKCSASGNPLPQITWSLDGAQVPEDQSFRSGDYVTLENTVISYVNISRAGVEHSGEFTCAAKNDAGEVEHSSWVRVPGPPFVRTMKNQTIVAGEMMKIRCPAGGYPIHRISWERDGVRLPDNHRQTVYPNGTLLVRQVERMVDEGRYTCTLRNKEGESAKGSVYITVRVRPVIEPFNLPSSVQMGQRLSISCTVIKGDPPITLKWLRDEDILEKDGDIRIHNLADYSSTLLFESIKPEHRGNYTCVASNEAGSERHSAAMVIHVPPRWKTEPNDVDVIKGRSIMIDCEADGFPPPRLTWRKAAGSVPESYKPISSSSHLHVFENGTLTILDVGEHDAGYYLCQASNGIGSGLSKVISLTVHVAAHFTNKFHAEIVKKGQEAKLSCQAYGERPLNIAWTKDKQTLNTKSITRYRLTETVFSNGSLSELLIDLVDRGDSALFTCLATNSYGKDETNIQLIIQEKPDIPQELKITRTASRSVDISWSPPYSGNSRLLKYILTYEEATEEKEGSLKSGNLLGGNPKRVTIPPSEITWTINGLTPDTRYFILISAVNALGESESSNPVTAVTEEEAPGGPPLAVKTLPLSSTAVKVLWEPPDPASQYGQIKGYYVGYKTKTSKDKYVYKTLEVKDNFREERILNNLQRNTKYLVRVQAFNNKGAGPPSDDAEVETLKEDPPKPPTLEILGVTSTSVTLKWKRDGTDSLPTKGFIVHYKKEYGTWRAEEVFGDLNTYTLINLQCGMRYEFYITNANGNGEQSEIVETRTSGRAPIAPEKEELLIVNATSVTIQLNSWKSGGCPITHFEIKYKQQKKKTWVIFADRVSSNKKSITITGLTPNTFYQLQLTSHNEAGPNTEAEYIFTTGANLKGALPDAVLVSGEAVPFYLELEVVLPVSLSLVVVVAVLVLVCLIVRKRNPTETSQTASTTYVSRKSQAGESVHLCEMEKSNYQRPPSRADPLYYPTPYATTHIADGPCRKSLEAAERELQEEPQYATVKRTPRPPKSDMHIYHYPGRRSSRGHT